MMSKWLGEAEKNVSKLFKMANKLYESENIPILLFLDEIDSLIGNRNGEVGGDYMLLARQINPGAWKQVFLEGFRREFMLLYLTMIHETIYLNNILCP